MLPQFIVDYSWKGLGSVKNDRKIWSYFTPQSLFSYVVECFRN